LNSIIKDKDNEIEALRRQLMDMGQEQRRQLDQLREQLELTFQQRLVFFIDKNIIANKYRKLK